MAAAGVPTAGSRTCTTPDEAAAALDAFGAPYVVKDDALAAGKGVVVTNDRDEALAHAAGCERVVVEEFLDGPEVSLFAVCDGRPAGRCSRPRTSSGSSTAAAAPTPAAWAPTRRCPGRPTGLVDDGARAPSSSRPSTRWRGAAPRSSAPSTSASR